MSKKNNGNAIPKAAQPTVRELVAPPEIRATVLETRDRELLSRGQRLLTMIQSPTFAARAARAGYSSEEHKEGWALLNLASGQGRSLDDCFLATRTSPTQGYDMSLLVAIDEFENTWFPRMHALIRRVVASQRRDEFESAFFKDLDQQPLGPAVVSSVRTFLSRLDDLEKSSEPNAKDVIEKLAARGLTTAVRKQMSDLVRRAEEGGEITDVDAMQKVADGQQAQREAVGRFRDWFNDWATTLRSVFPNGRHQLQLGLTIPVRAAADGTEEPADEPVTPPPNAAPAKPVAPTPA